MIKQLKKHKIFGRPRAPKDEKRSIKVAVFLTEGEAEELKITCEKLNITLPEFLRRAGLGKKIETRKSVFDADALEEIRAIGQSVNQTARELSRARTQIIPVDFQKLEAILRGQLETLNSLKNRIFNLA